MHNGLSMTEQPGGASFPRSRRNSWKSSSVPPSHRSTQSPSNATR